MQEGTFDPTKPFVDQNSLFEYENFAAFLRDEPTENTRNGNIRVYRQWGYTEKAVRAYAKAFDAVTGGICPGQSALFGRAHDEGIEAAKQTGGFIPAPIRTTISPIFKGNDPNYGTLSIDAKY